MYEPGEERGVGVGELAGPSVNKQQLVGCGDRQPGDVGGWASSGNWDVSVSEVGEGGPWF